jgi:hypothetical protein
MTILDDNRNEIRLRVDALLIGEQFPLRTLFGGSEAFANFGTAGQRKNLGTLFRKAVEAGAFDGVEYSHHAQSPTEHWYRRV